MKNIKILILLFFIASCSPVYQTSYEMVPPTTEKGRTCANNCLVSKTNCEKACHMDTMTCEARAQREMTTDPLNYVTVQNSEGLPIVRTQRQPRRYYNCGQNSCLTGCMEDYHACHTDCGGQVIPHSYCTAFCN